jgi:hypothetical protein
MKLQLYLPHGKHWDKILSVLNVWRRLGYWPNYNNPKTFNEYFLHEKFFFGGDLLLAKKLTDKIELKNWLANNGYEKYVIPTIFTSESVDELRDYLLPSKCVIKPAHSSGDLIIVNSELQRYLTSAELSKISSWLREDYYLRGREPNYKQLPRRIIIEKLLLDSDNNPPSDYKIECAGGVPFIIQVDIDRFKKHVRQLYTPDWHLLPYCTSFPRFPHHQLPPPQLAEALSIAGRLSSPFRLCRVDLYFLQNHEIKIGEITFYPANCAEPFEPSSGDLEAGRAISEILN